MGERTRPYRSGGLYRCCIARLADMPEEVTDTEGNTTRCLDCNTPLLFISGAWQWSPWVAEVAPFICPDCGNASHNPHDARTRFCAHCGQFKVKERA